MNNLKLGQLFSIGYQGKEPSPDFLKMVRNYQIGGIILFSDNIDTTELLKETIKLLQEYSEIPLFVMIDQEGGRVNRITHNFPLFPANRLYGENKDKEGVKEAYSRTAKELKRLGINVNLSPVVDVLTNPSNQVIGDRSFGPDAELVAELSKIAIQATRNNGVLAGAKHFPGIGDIYLDPHKTLPYSSNPKERFEKIDFLPFKAAISEEVDFIMSTHLLATELDPIYPATLSRKICTQILREELNFQGVLITDDMQMGAIRENYPLEEACFLAFEAGNDMILLCENLAEQIKVIEYFEKELQNKKLKISRLSEALNRISSLKEKKLR